MTETKPQSTDNCSGPRGCRAPLSEHIGGKSCVVGAPSTAKSLHDLPIFGRFWAADGRERNA
jgi:hypothetical protein